MKCENLWRINIKPDVKNRENPREFCINNNILGVGWSVGDEKNMSWEEYYDKALKKYYYKNEDSKEVKDGGVSWWKALNAICNRMKEGDLCWARDEKGIYYLGKITGDWKYRHEDEYQQLDLVNIRECEWVRIGTVDEVPGKVVNSFAARSAVQRVSDDTALEYSKLLYNLYVEDDKYEIKSNGDNIFSLLSSDDCENVVGLYLQKELGYLIIPKTNRNDTVKYEFVLKNKDTGKKAIVQVKNGNVSLKKDEFKNIADKAFLFTTEGEYTGKEDKDVICLEKQVIEKFIYDNRIIMPDLVQRWINHIEGNI